MTNYDSFSYEDGPAAQPVIHHVIPEQPKPFNKFAIWGFVVAFFFNLLGVILSHVALAQISKTHDNGKGLAIAGLVVGYLSIVIMTILVIWGVMWTSSATQDLVNSF